MKLAPTQDALPRRLALAIFGLGFCTSVLLSSLVVAVASLAGVEVATTTAMIAMTAGCFSVAVCWVSAMYVGYNLPRLSAAVRREEQA